MKISRHLILSLAAVIVLMTGSRELLAQQQSAPLFTERFANVFDPSSRTYFSLQGTEGKQFGGQQPFASIGATHYLGEIDEAVTLYSGQFMMNYNAITGNPAGSLGVQQRWLTDLPVLERSILGAGLYVDFTQSRYNNLFQQINVNLELFTESAWVARANAYLPVGQIQQSTGLQTVQGGAAGQLSVVGTAVGIGGINQQWMDVALMGTDLELGRKFFNYRTEVYGGYYNWNGPLAGFANGVKGGVRSYITNNLSGNVNISHDQFFGTNVYGGLTYFFGGSGGSRPNSFENLMTLPAQRSQQVSIGNYMRDVSTFKPLYDSTTGDALHMYFVKENGLGSGTQANPSNVNSVLADTHFATGSAMVLLDANGNITSPIALNHDRQQVIGGGSTGTADVDFSLALGQAPGTSVVHLSNLGGRPVLAPTTGNAVTLTTQNTIQGFTIDGSGGLTNGISGNPGATDTVIRDMTLQNIAGTGIKIQPSTNTTVDNVTFANNGVDLLLNASNSKISNITSTGAINGSLNLGGSGGDITGTTLISNVTISGAGGFGGILLNNAQNGSITNLTNVNISAGAGSGVTVSNSQTGSIYNLTNVDVLNVGANGMSLQTSNGTFNVDGTSSITNAGTAALAINGGAINVQFDGGITQGVTGSAVAVTGNHTGTVNFGAGSTINTTLGDGLQFDGADGSYTFLGTTNMNGGDAGIDIFNSNGSFVFTNPFINNTASGMGVKIVGGGGDSPVTTFNGLNISSISNHGFYVSNGGLTTVNGTATVNTQFGTAFESQGTSLAAVFTDITSTQSPAAGININNSSGTFGVTGTATISGAALSGINIMSSNGLTSTFQNVAISNVGTGALDNGVTLSTAGTVNILGGTINGTTGDGINSNNTNLTATGLNIGGTGTITGDGIEIVNTGTARTVNLSNNTIKANASGISTKDSGAAKELLLTLDGNTLQSLNGGSLALSVIGTGTNSTIIQSMSGGTIIGGTGGGVSFNRVTFDASGTALSGTQLNAGNWTIGTTGARVQGDGLRFDAPTGDLKFGAMNIANNSGTGLYVDTKTLGTTFALSNSGGSVDTTSGAGLFLDPLTTNLTFGAVSSTNSTTNGATVDTVTGILNINQFTVNGAAGSGLLIQNSSGLTSTIQNLAITTVGTTGADNGVTLSNAGNVNLLVGSIQGTTGDGIHSTDTNLTINGLGITGGSIAGDALQIVNTAGSHTVNVSNSALYGGTSALTTSDSGASGGLVLSLDNNTYISTGPGSVAFNVTGSGLNSTIIKSMNGGTVFSGGSANFNRVTFDASGTALSGTQVNAGNWTFGGTSRLNGDGLNLTSTTGDLQFGNLIINNDGGTGLLVDTKTLGTTFTLGNAGGIIDTANGAAMALDPLTTDLTFSSVTSVNSSGNGITLDTVGGTVNLGTVYITNATGSGLSIDSSTAAVTATQLNINGAVDGLLFGSNTGGSFTATGTTTISNVIASGINMQGAAGTYNLADLNITSLGAFTGLDFRNSNVLFTAGNTTITGNGAVGSIGIDLSGSTNPNGANSTTSNIHLANGAGQTAIINNVDTGILLGNVVDGSAGAYLVYGNQTALNSGSQINVTPSGLTLDTTNLTSTNGYTQGRYEFLGVAFTGIASFQQSNDLIFVGSTSSGTDDGSSPLNRISAAQLLALDATPSNLDGKTVVLVNDNGGVGINLGANTLTLGDNTILDSFGNGQTFSTNGVLPVNVIVDTISGNVVYSDPNGAATLTNNGSMNLVTLGNGDTVQNLILNGGTNTIFGSGIAGANINNNTITGASLAGISLTNTTGAIGITQNTINNTGTDGILLTNAGAVSVNGGTINGTGGDGIHSSDTNLTATGVDIGGTGTITGDGIEIVNGGSAHTVTLSGNTIKANASGISTVDSGNAGELVLTLDGNTLQSLNAGSKALSVLGGGPNSTIVASMNGGTVIGGANSGGVVFNQVTFDASGSALSGTQVAAGNWTIGTNGARVQGDGLRFDGPSGNLAFGNLNISNNAGTGLYVDTKTLGTTFTLNNSGGSVDTTGGSAFFLDPLTTNMTFGTVTSANSTGTGMTLDAVSGSLTIGTLNVSNSLGDGVYVNNSTGTFNINGGSIAGALGDSFHVNGGSANMTYDGSITSSAGRVAYITGTTGGGVTFGGLIEGEGPGEGIRLTNNAGDVTFNGDVSLGAATALSNEAVYLTNNSGSVTFGNLDVNVNTLTALGAIYGTNNSLVTIGGGNIASSGAAALNFDLSKIDITLSSITASGSTDGLDLTNLASGSSLNSTTTTITGVEQTGIKLLNSQGTYNFGTLEINGAKKGIDFRNSNLSFTSANTTLTGDGSGSSIAIDLSGTQNPNGANSTTPNIQLANAAGQTAIINNFTTGVRMGNAGDGSAGAYFIYGNQTPIVSGGSGSEINVVNGGLTLDATHLTSTDPYTQGRYEFTGVSFTGVPSFTPSGVSYLFVGSVSAGSGDGSTPTNRLSIVQLLALDATPSNLSNKTIVLINDSGTGGGSATLDMGANALTLGDNTVVDSFGNGQSYNIGYIVPVNVITDSLGATYTDPFGNGAATLTNNGVADIITLGNTDTVQNFVISGGNTGIAGSGVTNININHMTIGGTSGASGINLANTTGTIALDANTITGAGLNGITLNNAGTVSITGGSIDGVSNDGINSTATNLTVSGITIGGISAPASNGITIAGNGLAHTVNINNSNITAGAIGIATSDTGVSGELVLSLDGNTVQSTGGGMAIDIVGSGLNSTIVQSMNGGTILGGGSSGGVTFDRVTFDASGSALSGTQVQAGDWTIGTPLARVQGDGLVFNSPTGDLAFGNLNIANDGGTGLYVDTKSLGTTFTLGNTGGSIDTTNGSAAFLDPLTVNMNLSSITSTNAAGDNGVTFDTVGGTITVGSLNVSGAGSNGLYITDSSGLTSTFTTVTISNVGTVVEDSGIGLNDAGIVNILGGTIDGTTGDGIHSDDTNLTATGLSIGGASTINGDGIHVGSIAGTAHTANLSNNTIKSTGVGISSIDSGTIAGELVLTLDNNSLQSTSGLAMNLSGSLLNSTIIQSMNGGTIIGGATSGGVKFDQVTFDASGATLSGTQVLAGDWTIGTTGTRVNGDGLRFDGPSGDLAFDNLNIANNGGTGLYVDTKSLGTTFSLGNNGGTIDTTSGSAAFLDPLTTNLTFSTINSTGSGTNGITLDTVAGTFTVNEGTITNATNAGINIFDSSATVDMTGVVVYTNGGTGVKLNGNTGAITFTDMTMIRSSGNTAFNIDATTGSTGKITIDGSSSIGNTPGTAFQIGAGSRDIDASALAITNDNTTTGPVISITNQTGGTIDFGTVTNSGTTANQVIRVGSFASGTVNFGATTITNFGNESTDRAVNIIGIGGMVNFADLDITTTNGGGLAMGSSGLNPGSSPTIDATGGNALTLNGGTVVNGTFDSIKATNTGASNRGIVIGVIAAPITINAIDINGTGTVGNPAEGIFLFNNVSVTLNNFHINGTTGNGITVQNGGTVNFNNGTIGNLSSVAGDGISYTTSVSLPTTLNITDVTIGSAGLLAVGDQGIVLSSTGTGALTANIHGGSVYATNEALATSDTGTAKQLVLSLGGTTGTQIFDRASAGNSISVVGSGLNSTIVTQLGTSGHGVIVEGGSGSGGVLFNRVTFDASGTSLSGTQVAGAELTIGSLGTRVVGDGLRFDAPTGDLSFGNLTIFNDNGTGLYVDTKTLGTTFTLGSSGGSIDTTNGAATYLDPLTTNMTLDSLSSSDSGGNGVWLDGVAGTFTVTGTTTVTNAGLNGVLIENSSGTINFNDVNVDTTGADGLHMNTNTGTINVNGTTTIQNTIGDGIDGASTGGGVTFGAVGITDAGAHGINLGTATGTYAFGATTINGFGINKTGISFAGASAAATFGVTDIQNAGNGTGIDLSSTTGNKTITFATGSNISNVNLGVELSSSHTTATTANANFTFGDGAVPAGSTIDATTTVNAIGLDAASGTYNFNDVTFTGTASLPGGAGGALFVSATAVNGAGDGSLANPYSVSDADAVTTDGATFAFLDGTYDFNTLNGGNPFTLGKNQSVEGFDNGNTVAYGTVQPANISGNLGATGGIATRTGSLSITNSAATDMFTLLGGNNLVDITLTASGSTTALVSSNGAVLGFDNTNGISLNGVTMTNTSGSAIGAAFTGINGNVSIQGNNINFTNGRVLSIDGGTANYTIARGIQPDAGNTPGILSGPAITIKNTTGGSVSLNGMTLSGTGTLVTLDNNDATFSFANNTFSGGTDSTLFNIDTLSGGSTSDLTFGGTNSITQARGTIAKIGAGARNIDLSLFDFNNINTTAANVISSVGQTGGTIKFGNIGISNYNNAAGTAVSLTGTGGTVQFADLDIAAANGNGLNVGGITFAAGATPTISTSNGRALILDGTTLAGGNETFDSITSNGGFIGINLNNVTGTTNFTTVDIDNTSGRGIVLGNAGTVFINGGTIDGTSDSGIYSFNTNLNVTGLTLGGTSQIGNIGIEVMNNSGSRTLAVNGITVTDAVGAGISVDGSGGGTTTVTSFNGNTVSNAGAGGILFDTVTFDSDTATAGIQQVTGGNTTIGDLVTTTNITGDGLVLNNVLGDIAFGTLNIGNDNGTGLYIRDAAGKVGSFAFTNTSGSINTTNGAAMDIDPVTMNSTFASVKSTNANGQGASTLGTGINLDTIAGSVTINAGSITGATGDSFRVNGGTGSVTYSGNITHTTAGKAAVSIGGGHNTGTVTFNTGTISATDGTGLQFDNADGTYNFTGTTTLNGGNAGVDILNGSAGTFAFGTGTTITSPTGTAFNVDSSSANVTYSGNITQANNSSLVSISNESAGTITFQTGTLGATNGNGIQLSNVDSTVNFNGTTTLNGGDAGIDIISGSSGTITFGTGTTVTNPSGLPYNEDTSTANVTFNGSITKTSSSNSAININAKTGGTTSFNGLVTATTGATNAISLTSNSGGTINFGNTSGTSNITTTSGNGFNFTGGGTLNVTGNNYVVSSTSGTGFNATAGTVTATGTGNTVASTTGRAVNINGATIGGSGVTFRSVSANGGSTSAILLNGTGAGNFTVTGDGTAAAGAQGGNASGGTIQNITGADAISLNNVSGIVSLKSMSILNITAGSDASDAKQTLSGVDAIQGTGTIGGLSLVGVKISNTSDMAINGVTGTSWNGLTIDNSLLEKSNRFGVSGKGDDNNEGMVQILGITGTATITNSKFDQGARLLDLQTGTSGNLNLTATNNTFSNSWKGFDSAADSIYYVGGDAVRILTQGSATATVIIGDQNQSNASLGNYFLNDKYSLTIGHTNSTDTGLIKTTVSENNFQVTNHKSPTGSPLFNYPNGTVLLLGRGVGGLNANVSNNTFDQLTDNQGLFGSLNVAAENGTTQVKINNNTFIKPWDHSMHLRSNNSATLTAEINNNTYVTGSAGGAGTDSAAFNGPWDNVYVESIGSGTSTVNVTVHDEAIPTNVFSANDLAFKTSFAGQTMNVFLYNVTAPKGYQFNSSVAGATINIYRNSSVSGTVAGILSDNNVTGGAGSTSTDPPTVNLPGAGTVQGSNTPVLLPSFTVP